jgi:hypothetical protein
MPQLRILDTDPSKVDGITTFGNLPDLFQSIRDENAGSLSWTGKGTMHIKFRCSTGVPHTGQLLFSGAGTSIEDNLIITGEYSQGFPFRTTDAPASAGGALLNVSDNNLTFDVSARGAAIIEADETQTFSRSLIASDNPITVNGWILNGKSMSAVSGVSASVTGVVLTNCTFIGIVREFYGPIRSESDCITDQCTFVNCDAPRQAGTITNSMFIDCDLSSGDGFSPNDDYNVFTNSSAELNYSGAISNANSTFGIIALNQLVPYKYGGFDIQQGSVLGTSSSVGGPLGASAEVLTPSATVSGNIVRGQSFDIAMVGYYARATLDYVEVYIRDAAGDATEYPCTVTVNGHFLISATAPGAGSIANMVGVEVVVRPIISF